MDDRPGDILNERAHPRVFRTNQFVYPVLSRRAGGISIGINLSPDKACNFHCVYCQVDRTAKAQVDFVALPKLLDELKLILGGLGAGGWLWREPEFRSLDPEKAHVADVAFSGDGEPTTFRNFAEVVTRCTEVKEQLGFREQKVVVITNATGLDRPEVRRALEFLDSHRGEVWAKLDAGTPGYFALLSGSKFPFEKLLNNILNCARERSIVIQSCFVRLRREAPSHEQIGAYIRRLKELVKGGAKIRLVQVYTAARDPAFSIVSSLSNKELDAIADRVRRETALPAATFYGDVPEGRGVMDQGSRGS